jgi:hypothetical protein
VRIIPERGHHGEMGFARQSSTSLVCAADLCNRFPAPEGLTRRDGGGRCP